MRLYEYVPAQTCATQSNLTEALKDYVWNAGRSMAGPALAARVGARCSSPGETG